MAWTFENYQRGGQIDEWHRAQKITRAHSQIIADLAGMPELRQQLTPGSYAHEDGLATDLQPGGGRGNPEGMAALEPVITDPVVWQLLGIRYAAGRRHEYGGTWGGPERKRPQVQPYRGNDEWHDNHWHVDFHPGAEVRTLAEVRAALGHDTDTDTLTEDEMKQLDRLIRDMDNLKAATERNERRLDVLLARDELDADSLAHIEKRIDQNNAVLSLIDPRRAG